jgi:glycosyltransferase involved in cell wall biosynthesis
VQRWAPDQNNEHRRGYAIVTSRSGIETAPAQSRGAIALVANYESDVGYAWWLMENFWAMIATHASGQGRRCLLAYPRIGVIPEKIRHAPLDIHEFRFARDGWKNAWRTARFLRAHAVTSVYLTDWPYLHWCYVLWRMHGVRRIVMHDHSPGVRPAIGGARGLLKRIAFAARWFSCDQYVAVSKYIGQRHLQNARVPAHLDVVVENGIVPFDPAHVQRSAVREALGIPADAFLIVLVSRATYYKGLDFAVQAVARMLSKANQRPVYAVHCGDGPDVGAFRQLASQLQIAERFVFLGKRSDVREILASADVAFHPSRGEAMSLAILEFMCAGLPVVVPDNPSVCTSLEHQVSGLLYAEGNLDAATRSLLDLYSDDALRIRLGRAARQACLDKYLLEHTNASFANQVIASL